MSKELLSLYMTIQDALDATSQAKESTPEANSKLRTYSTEELFKLIKDLSLSIIKDSTEYEKELIKLESDIRKHLKSQFQMKLYIDSIESNLQTKDIEIKKLTEKLAEANKKIGSLEEESANKSKNISSLEQSIKEKERETKDLIKPNNPPLHSKQLSLNIHDKQKAMQNITNSKINKNTVFNDNFKSSKGFIDGKTTSIDFNSSINNNAITIDSLIKKNTSVNFHTIYHHTNANHITIGSSSKIKDLDNQNNSQNKVNNISKPSSSKELTNISKKKQQNNSISTNFMNNNTKNYNNLIKIVSSKRNNDTFRSQSLAQSLNTQLGTKINKEVKQILPIDLKSQLISKISNKGKLTSLNKK